MGQAHASGGATFLYVLESGESTFECRNAPPHPALLKCTGAGAETVRAELRATTTAVIQTDSTGSQKRSAVLRLGADGLRSSLTAGHGEA